MSSFNTGIKLVGLFVVIVVVTLWKGCSEIHYMVAGKKVQATVVSVKEAHGGRRRQHIVGMDVSYSYQPEKGRPQEDIDRVDLDLWKKMQGNTIEITYVSGDPYKSVISANRTKFWVVMLLLGFIALGITFWRMYQQAQKDLAFSKR